MQGMGLKFTPVIGRHLLSHLSMFGPMHFLDSLVVQTVLKVQFQWSVNHHNKSVEILTTCRSTIAFYDCVKVRYTSYHSTNYW